MMYLLSENKLQNSWEFTFPWLCASNVCIWVGARTPVHAEIICIVVRQG